MASVSEWAGGMSAVHLQREGLGSLREAGACEGGRLSW